MDFSYDNHSQRQTDLYLEEIMAIIFAGSGKKGSGKTLLWSQGLSQRGFKSVNFADVLKHKCRTDFLLTPEHTDGNLKEIPAPKLDGRTPRELMIDIGQLYRKYSADGNYWLNAVLDKVEKMAPDQLVYIGDCRFVNEADAIKEAGGIIIRLDRDPKLNIYKPSDDPSECALDDYDFDIVLPANKNRNPQDLEVFSDAVKECIDKTKDQCKGDYSRFSILFRNNWSHPC